MNTRSLPSVFGTSRSRGFIASAWAAHGWHAVPFKPDRSKAYVRYKDQPKPTPSVVAEWFEKWGDALLCIKLPREIVVLDLDIKTRSLADIQDELKDRYSLPETCEIQTPSGGLHLWFELPSGVTARNWTSDHGRFPVAGVDIRTNGGLATLPPSVRPSGAYTWRNWLPIVPIAPNGLVDHLRPKIPQPQRRPVAPLSLDPSLTNYAQAALTSELTRVTCAGPGSRNHALFVASASLGSLHVVGLLPDVRHALEHAASVSGLSKDDGIAATRATIASGWKRGIQNPRSIGIGGHHG